MPDAPGLELISQKLNEAHSGAVIETAFEHDKATLIVDSTQVLGVLHWLRDTPEQGYRFLASLHAADYLPGEPRFAVHYELLNMPRVERLNVKALIPNPAISSASPAGISGVENGSGEALPEIDSCVEIFPTAEFHEREAWEFFGIVFRGHPDLRRLLLPEDYEGWPQRRDFPVGGEPVLFTKDEPGSPGWYE